VWLQRVDAIIAVVINRPGDRRVGDARMDGEDRPVEESRRKLLGKIKTISQMIAVRSCSTTSGSACSVPSVSHWLIYVAAN